MTIKVHVTINATKERVWKVLTDIEHLCDHLTLIDHSEIILRPTQGILGLKWSETRTFLGDQSSAVKCFTDIDDLRRCEIQTKDHEEFYTTVITLKEYNRISHLSLVFSFHTQYIFSHLAGYCWDLLFSTQIKKDLLQDLLDIKRVAEAA